MNSSFANNFSFSSDEEENNLYDLKLREVDDEEDEEDEEDELAIDEDEQDVDELDIAFEDDEL